jgi:hypothetical protein
VREDSRAPSGRIIIFAFVIQAPRGPTAACTWRFLPRTPPASAVHLHIDVNAYEFSVVIQFKNLPSIVKAACRPAVR